jgi:hypothetical protein
VIEVIAFGPVVNGRSAHSAHERTFIGATVAAFGRYLNTQSMNSGSSQDDRRMISG